MGIEGPSNDANPGDSNALDYLSLLWPATLCELIVLETNRYALQRGVAKWRDVSTAEIWTFLGIVILMGIKRLLRISNYWSRDSFIGVPGMNQYMSVTRFWAVWSNLHVVDNESIVASSGLSRKIQPVVDTLGSTYAHPHTPPPHPPTHTPTHTHTGSGLSLRTKHALDYALTHTQTYSFLRRRRTRRPHRRCLPRSTLKRSRFPYAQYSLEH